MSFFNELKRRNVLRVGAAYVVAAWLVIQVIETIFPAFGFGDAAIRIATIVFAIGLIPTLIFAWAFELTPEGLKKESEVDRSSSITPHTGKKLDRMIMVVLALALGYFAFDKFVLTPQREAQQLASLEEQKNTEVAQALQQGRTEGLVESYGDKSIAVLPFVNMSSDVEQEYFSDGISEELLNLLAKIPELRVISRSSAFSYKGKDIKLAQVAEELNVAHILEGSVRKGGNQVRITAQLIEARSDTHLWSETYDRQLDDIFAIQDEIAATVVEQLKITLLGATPKMKKIDPGAYALYLQAKFQADLVTPESLNTAVSLYKQVLDLDPGYAQAWIGLGGAYNRMVSLRQIPADEGRALSLKAAQRAFEIAPDSADAHRNLAWGMYLSGDNLKQIAHHYQMALQLEPTNTAVVGDVSIFLSKLNRLSDSVRLAEYQASRDPANHVAYNNLGMRYRYAGQLAEAEEAFSTALALNPSMGGVYYELGVSRLQEKDYSGAAEAFANEPISVFKNVGLTMTHYAQGGNKASNEILQELISDYGGRISYYIAQIYSFRGETDKAFEWLEKAQLAGDRVILNAICEPLLENLHADERWIPFLAKNGQSPQQLALINFEVKLPD